MGKNPAFLCYPADWERDLGEHPLEIEGAWFRICRNLWWSPTTGRATKTLTQWGGVLRVDPERAKAILEYLRNADIATIQGIPSNGDSRVTLISRRMVRDEKLRKIRAESGKKGGNPLLKKQRKNGYFEFLDNQNPTTQDNQNPTTGDNQTPEDEEEVVNKLNRNKKRKILSLEEYLEFAKKEICQCLSRDRTDFKTAYPGIDLDRESAAALVWLKNNPTERKKNIGRFMNNWFSRAQEKTRRPPSIGETGGFSHGTYRKPYSPRDMARSAALDDAAERINREWRESKKSGAAQNQAHDHPESDAP